jgi:monoamine oxidase
MYGNNIATNSYLSHYIMDWIKEPFIQGSYSFPAPNSKNSFLQLSLPIDNKLYFAGEATNYTGHNATVHGAIESGITCADNIIKDLQ